MPAPTPAQVKRAQKVTDWLHQGCLGDDRHRETLSSMRLLKKRIAQALADEAERATTRERERIIKAGDMWTASAWTSSDLDKAWARFTAAIRTGDAAVSRTIERTM